jgi:hypothetical protein
MKQMKTTKIYVLLLILGTFIFSNCNEQDDALFTADLSTSEIAFENTFASEYILSKETEENIADRFIWNKPTPITTNNYELEASISSDFTAFTSLARTSATNHIVLVGQLLALGTALNLDDDPTTTDANGEANDSGVVYIRVKATIGNGGAGSDEILSEISHINIRVLEKELITSACESLYVLGAGITDVGWNFPGIETVCDADILKVKARLGNDHFRFFTTIGDWDSGLDYSYYENEGFTIDAALENSPAGDNFSFIGTPGIYTITIDNVGKTIQLEESSSLWAVGGAVPGGWGFNADTIEFVENTPNIWSASIILSNDIFRFFQTFGTWDTNNNLAYYVDQGFTIDLNLEDDGGSDANFNFIGTAGTYTLTINAVDKTITLN